MTRVLLLTCVFLWTAPVGVRAGEDRYDPRTAGHPVRVLAYVLHPIGVILDYAFFRPAWKLGGYPLIRTLVGRPSAPEEVPPERPANPFLTPYFEEP